MNPKPAEAQIKFRIDQDLRDQLENSATSKGVSLNREITDRLLRSLQNDEPALTLDTNKPAFGILKAIEVAMDASGEAALFTRTRSWEIAKGMNWLDDSFAYDQAVSSATTILAAFRPVQTATEPAKWNINDGVFWAEFFLKQIASGLPNVPENAPLVEALRNHLGEIVERISDLANIDPDDRAGARFLNNGAERLE